METVLYGVVKWVKEDWASHPVRCVLEIIAWAMSISCSIILMVTVPTPPWLLLYPLFITQCCIFAWAAWTRKSSGMFANYLLLVGFDSIALGRLLML